jgi:dephospho-CoA kinase
MSPPKNPILAVLGGIASGKSHVARILAGAAGTVIDADQLAHTVLASDELTALIQETYGPECLGPDGRPDRVTLSERIFSDPEERTRLEGWIHPRVRAKILLALDEAKARDAGPVVLDVPLLLENDLQENDTEHGLVARCDHLVFVECDLDARDQRAVSSRGWSPGEVARREQSQLPLSEKMARADHTIHNRDTLEELDRKVRLLAKQLHIS